MTAPIRCACIHSVNKHCIMSLTEQIFRHARTSSSRQHSCQTVITVEVVCRWVYGGMKSPTSSSISESSAYTELIAHCLTIRVLIRDSIRICIHIRNLMHNLTLCLALINDNLARRVFKCPKAGRKGRVGKGGVQRYSRVSISNELQLSWFHQVCVKNWCSASRRRYPLPINIYSPIVSAT